MMEEMEWVEATVEGTEAGEEATVIEIETTTGIETERMTTKIEIKLLKHF